MHATKGPQHRDVSLAGRQQ